MALAADFQTTLLSFGSSVSLDAILNTFTNMYTRSAVATPFIVIGLISTIVVLINYIKEKKWTEILLLTFIWILTIDIIVVSNVYFIYHYFLLVLPSFISTLLVLKQKQVDISYCLIIISALICFVLICVCWKAKSGYEQIGIINYSTVLLVILHLVVLHVFAYTTKQNERELKTLSTILLLSACMFFWMNYSTLLAPKFQNERALLKRSEEICANLFPEDFGDEPVLFLDGGTVPFYIDAPSYSRYFFNLPMQRWNSGDNWEIQEEEYQNLMNYDGKYIVYSSWFGLDKYPELKEKIEREYQKIENSGIYTFSPDWDMFLLRELPDIDLLHAVSDTYILKRLRE